MSLSFGLIRYSLAALVSQMEIWVTFVVEKVFCRYHINTICLILGKETSRALPHYHAFSGCDTTFIFNKGNTIHGRHGKPIRKSTVEEFSSNNLINLATDAVQATGRLYHGLKRSKNYKEDDFLKIKDSIEKLQEVKASLEGSDVDFSTPDLDENELMQLKQLTLMHIPESITDEARKKFQHYILSLFKGQNVTVLYAALLTCPWYARTQRERGEQAKHNIIFIIFKCSLSQYLSPISSHVQEQANVIDKGWFSATELYHFCHYLCKGKTRNVEGLYCPLQAVLYEDPQWNSLRTGLNIFQTIGLRGFLEACRGQSVGGVGKKGKDGKFRIKDSTTFKALCDSFRLMHHAHSALNGQPLCLDTLDESQLPSVAQEAVTMLKDMYQNLDISKKDVFEFLEQWQKLVSLQVKKFTFTDAEEVYRIVGNWQMEVRLQGNPIICLSSCPEDEHPKLLSLMEDIRGPMSHLHLEQILMVTRAGSHMYDLSMATSDIDYVIIYADPSEKILTACKKLPESVEDRGPQKKIEYGAYEVRCFCEMLMKGSVVILELLFKDGHNYTHPAWRALADKRSLFVTERGIQQYMGLIRNNILMLQKEKLTDNTKERKLFYQIFHKMESVEYLLKGMVPPVKCSGPIRDFIMRIRTAPLEGDLQRDKLYEYCLDRFERLKENLANRRYRLKENADFKFLLNWLLSVRGLDNIP